MNWFHDVWSVLQDSLLEGTLPLVQGVPWEPIKMRPDKETARDVLLVDGPRMRAASPLLTVSQSVDMAPTVPQGWCHVWSVLETPILRILQRMDTSLAASALRRCSPSNPAPRTLRIVERNVPQATTAQLDWLPVPPVLRTISSLYLARDSASDVSLERRQLERELPVRMTVNLWYVAKICVRMEENVCPSNTGPSVIAQLASLDSTVR